MSRLRFLAITIILLALGKVQGSRSIRLSSDVLVPVRVDDHLELNSSILISKPLNSTEYKCIQYYGFLPCATNIPGYIFQIIILEFLLLFGVKNLTKGRQQLFSILGVGIYGATIFRVLEVLPTIVLLLASGLALNKEAAQARVKNGAGMLAGSTIFYLTLQWGICVFLGKTKTPKKSSPTDHQKSSGAGCLPLKRRLSSLREYGVATDKRTCYTAKIMLVSLVPFLMVEVAIAFKSRPRSHILNLTVSVAGLISYFVFQSRHQWIQQRSLQYSKNELMLSGFLDHLQRCAKKGLVNDQGKVDGSCITSIFDTIDKDKDNHISEEELKNFLAEMKSEDLELDRGVVIEELIKHFDKDSNHLITNEEFIDGCKSYIRDAKQMVVDKNACSRKYLPRLYKTVQPLINRKNKKQTEIEQQWSEILSTVQNQQLSRLLTDGQADDAKMKSLFEEFDEDKDGKMSVHELKGLLMSKFECVKLDPNDVATKMMKVFDDNKDNELQLDEFLDGFKKRVSNGTKSQLMDQCVVNEKSSIMKKVLAAFQVVLGVAIVSSLGLPLVNNTQLLSERLGIPPFFISFVVLPLAVNFKTVMATIFPASRKKEGASSIMFCEIYGAVFMNNILGLLSLLGLVWARGFIWEFSAEVLILLVVTAIIGVIGSFHIKYPLWTSILAFSLYPLSLVLFYIIRYLFRWK